MIVTKDKFLDSDTTEYLKAFIAGYRDWEDIGHSFWLNRVIWFSKLSECDAQIIYIICNNIAETIKIEYSINQIYCNTIDLVKWEPGWSQPPHMDACEGLEFRDFGSVIYLNDDFNGGHTYYPNLDIEVVPKAGMLVVHPGTKDFYHGVTEVLDKTRYTIASFWSTQKDKEMSYESLFSRVK